MSLVFGVLALLAGYFIGNISPAILIGKMAGIDIRKEGSGNAGTTNVLRVLGKKAAIATLIIDILKGTIAVVVGGALGFLSNDGGSNLIIFGMLAGVGAICGHSWPIIFGFKGGKGSATSFGVLLGINPLLGLACFGVALTLFIITRRASIGSIGTALLFPIMTFFIGGETMPSRGIYFLWALSMSIIVIFNHRGNIKRLIKNEEPKVKFRKEEESK